MEPARELTQAKQDYRRHVADEAYERIRDLAEDRILRAHDPRTFYAANIWIHEQGYGKTPEQIIHHQGAKWEMALNGIVEGIVVHIGGGEMPFVSPVDDQMVNVETTIIEAQVVEDEDEFVLEFNYVERVA